MLHEHFYRRKTFISVPARLGIVLVLLMTMVGIAPVQAAPAATYTVTNTNDSGANSLRWAITQANTSGGADTIVFSGVSGTITLNSDLPEITEDVTITGPGADSLTVSGQDSYRPFKIASGATVEISSLTITGGSAQDGIDGNDGANGSPGTGPTDPGDDGSDGGTTTAATDGGDGGGIHNSGDLTLIRCTIFDNAAGHGGDGGDGGDGGKGFDNSTGDGSDGGNGGDGGNAGDGGDGGGIYNAGTLVISKTTIYSNTAGNAGIAGNGGTGGVGGGAVGSTATAGDGGNGGNAGSTGDAGHGGGVYNAASASLTMHNCTISGNTAGVGGKGGDGGDGGKGGVGWSSAAGGDGGDGGTCTNGHDGGNGGGIYNASGSTTTLLHCTIVDNITGDGGDAGSGGDGGGGGGGDPEGSGGTAQPGCPPGDDGDGGGVYDAGGTTNVKNTILANNSTGVVFPPNGAGPDCYGNIASGDYNLIEDISGCSVTTDTHDITGLAPKLSALRDNGGDTWTHALLPTSPAIDKVPPSSSTLDSDQRDEDRPLDGLDDGTAAADDGYCDIGAYEDGPPEWEFTKGVVGSSTVDPNGTTVTFRIEACNNGGGWADSAAISDTLPSQLTFADSVQLTGATGTKADDAGDMPDLVTDMSAIAIGDCVTVTFETTVACTATATITNWAWITSTKTVTPEKDSASVTIRNVPPVATDDDYNATEDTALTVSEANGVLYDGTDDSDENCDTLTTTLVSGPSHGTVKLNLDGSFVYTPTQDYCTCNGGDTFVYRAHDGKGGTDDATVEIDVACDNDGPNADDDEDSTDEDTAIDIEVLANDDDVDIDTGYCGDTLTVDSVTQPVSGTVTNNTSNVNFDPDGDFDYLQSGESEVVTFTYTVEDSGDLTDTATVTVTVTGVNDGPTANDDCDTYQTDEDTVLNVSAPGVLDNDTDPEGDTLTVVSWEYGGNTAYGDVSGNSDGSFDYDPTTYYNYLDTGDEVVDIFDYRIHDGNGGYATATVCITVTGINDPPDADDDNDSTDEDTPVTINVLGNDTDPEDDYNSILLDVIAVTQPASGTVTINPDNTVTFTPTLNFVGTTCFSYTIEDSGSLTDTATVCVEVGGVNDCPDAIDDTDSTDEDTPRDIPVLANDIDPDSNPVISSYTQPTSGTVDPGSGDTLNYNPNGEFEYLAVGESAEVTFTYTITDPNGPACSDTAVVTVTITGVNDGPTANDDSYSVDEDDVLTVPADGVLGNDTDADTSDTLTVNTTPVDNVDHGTLKLNADGSFVYTPTTNYNGSDSFVYQISDGNGGSDTATVYITVNPINDEPTFNLDGTDVTRNEDCGGTSCPQQTVSGWANDMHPGPATGSSDPSNWSTLTFHVSNDNNGLFTTGGQPDIDESSGDLTFTPAPNMYGDARVTVYLTDSGPGTSPHDNTSSSYVFTITVNSVNDAPWFESDDVTVNEDSVAHTEDWQVPNVGPSNESTQTLTPGFTVVNDNNDLFSVQPDIDESTGDLTFTPDANMYGSATVTATLQDDGGTARGGQDTYTRTFTITVRPVNDEPSFTNGGDVTVNEDSGTHTASGWALPIWEGPDPSTISAPWDESGQVLTFTVSNDNNGLFSTQPDIDESSGDLTFKPADDMYGVAHVEVYLKDSGGTDYGGDDTSDTETFTITVRSVNDEPGFSLKSPHSAPVLTPVEWGTNAGPYTLGDGFAGDIYEGPTTIGSPYNETTQEVTFTLTYTCDDNCGTTTDCTDLFDELPAISGSLDPASGTLTFTPHAGCWGMAYVTATLTDDGGTDWDGDDTSTSRNFIIKITANARPIAEDDDAVTDEDTPWDIPVLDNDWDPDDGPGPLSITTVGTPEWGEAVISSTPGLSDTVLYTPTERPFTYVDVFTYTINDTLSDSLPAEVKVVIGDAVDREVTPAAGGGLFYTGVQTCTETDESMPISTTIEVPDGAVPGPVALVYSELPLDILDFPDFSIPEAPPGLGFPTRLFQLDVYSNAIRQEAGKGYTFTAPITLTLVNVCCQGGMTLSYYDEKLETWSEEGITVLEEDVQNGRLVVTTERLGLLFALACKPWPPVGGVTIPVSVPKLLLPLLLLAGMVITGTVATVMLKRRRD